jgi:hypothetical protein
MALCDGKDPMARPSEQHGTPSEQPFRQPAMLDELISAHARSAKISMSNEHQT